MDVIVNMILNGAVDVTPEVIIRLLVFSMCLEAFGLICSALSLAGKR